MGPPPVVTGVSPRDGPPGTRIIIRGENLGNDPKDLIGLKICGVDTLMTAEWKSSKKIIARTGPGKGKGDIIVTTRSGGVGSCTVGFRGFFVQIGPLQDSAVWIDETQTVLANLGRGRPSSPMISKDDEDPLGISNEGNRAKSEEEMLEHFPDASGNLALENFSPAWYLLENHQQASFDDLKMGLNYMKRRSSHQSEGPVTFAKANLSGILDCLDSLTEMYEKFAKDDIQRECINSYAVSLMQAKSCADGLFQEVLGRKDKADATRNALGVLQRFKFLFYLPLNIERNIQKEDYNLVINEYIRAKSLFEDSPIQVFQKVYKEVESQVVKFKEMLQGKLRQPNSLEEQKRLIKYLTSLDSDDDPGWGCLMSQEKWLTKLFMECKESNTQEFQEEIPIAPPRHKGSGGSIGLSLQAESRRELQEDAPVPPPRHKAAVVSSGLSLSAELIKVTSKSSDQMSQKFKMPQKVVFVEELTDIMGHHFPDFWKLGQAYFSGSLHKEGGDRSYKPDQNKHAQFKQMVCEILRLFSNLLRAAFLPNSLENLSEKERQMYGQWPENKRDVPGAWLPHCVRYVRSCASSLCRLDLPSDCQAYVQELALDMRTNCMFTLLKQAIADVRSLHIKETWIVELDDEFGGRTQLPALFGNIVNETVQHLHEVVVQNKTGETEIFSQRPVQIEATKLCTELLEGFEPCLEQLAFLVDKLNSTSTRSADLSSGSSELVMESSEDHLPSKDKKLIIMLSNCNHTKEHLIPRLVENLNKHGYLEMNKVLKSAQETYEKLDKKLFDAYVEEKSNPIIGAMEPNMYRGRFNWANYNRVNGVRNYLKEVLMGMIEIHAEVFSISPLFVSRVMTKIVDAVAEEMSRLIQCVTKFGEIGALQARLELLALQDAVTLYRSAATKKSFKEALDCLPDLTQENKKTLEDQLNKFKMQFKFQLMCFHSDTVEISESKTS
ncbi:hypothetical protein ACJMK2_009069 [Sinanodonta woodiana]|uniref:Exocyst complex component 2 n=1 Tax=Sinanodonta woodiana TaxID=1069815 RepID=A0ABD3VB47_SINWO